ncbi:MAG: hypothetical protein M1429_02525 [Patescibacteria group bacterium]|nr:hypothetical protein [Patescibacteria group bacterium]MCL5407345.1 hypothetical protein [Patescibacteria group bacterium]
MNLFKELLEKEMDRREFLVHIGALLLAVIGISALLRTLSNPHLLKKTNGFGSNSYGGKEGVLK